MIELNKKLQILEESLWIEKTRFDLAYMDSILDAQFFEYGRSGSVYTREDTLAHPYQQIKAKMPLENFQVHDVSETVKQVTYVSEVGNAELRANRSSIWVRNSDEWKLVFHQGTPIQKFLTLPKSLRCYFALLTDSLIHHQQLERLDTNALNREFFPGGELSSEDIPKLIQRFILGYEKYGTPIFMIYDGHNNFLGRAGFSYVEELQAIEIGYVLDHPYWGQGYATEIVSTLLDWASHHFKCEHIYAFACINHIASIRVMQKVGMKYCGEQLLKGIKCSVYKVNINKSEIT
ncbi:MAG: GNAT family N-acetyltransferase [Proteobacteria bacterium]|nr:GNAT family N-acetyltransferase [Pseudomonadota bacterium]